MKKTAAWLVAFLWGCAPAWAADDAKLQQLIRSKADEINQALIKGDYAKIADLTHPAVVKENGGRAKMIATMESAIKDLKAKGVQFRSAKIDAPGNIVTAGSDMYVVVPFSLVLTAPGKKISQKSFLIGVSSDKGKTWTYLNGDLGEGVVKRLLPNLPPQLKLPMKQAPVVEDCK
jgi:hypothetical protein